MKPIHTEFSIGGRPSVFAPALGLRTFAAAILPSGTLRTDYFDSVLGRPVLAMPLPGGQTVLSVWSERFGKLVHGEPRLICADSRPTLPFGAKVPGVEFACDTRTARGAGGVLRDVTRRFKPDDYVLVCGAKQVPSGNAANWAQAMLDSNADLVIGVLPDRSLANLFVVRTGVLSLIPGDGYCDFKEQAVPLIARNHSVEVVTLSPSAMWPMRSFAEYLDVVRRMQVEKGAEKFLVEEGGHVSPGARVRDSVILAGGRVEVGAVVVESIVGPGAVVGNGQVVIRQVLGGRSGMVSRL